MPTITSAAVIAHDDDLAAKSCCHSAEAAPSVANIAISSDKARCVRPPCSPGQQRHHRDQTRHQVDHALHDAPRAGLHVEDVLAHERGAYGGEGDGGQARVMDAVAVGSGDAVAVGSGHTVAVGSGDAAALRAWNWVAFAAWNAVALGSG
jgi:hypothetical protein